MAHGAKELELELIRNTIPNGTEARAAGVKWARVRGAYEVRREGGCGASAEVQGA